MSADGERMTELPRHTDIDEELLRSRLTPWLRDRVGEPGIEISAIGVPQGQGFSSETVLVDTTLVDDGRFVIKLPPRGETIFERYDLASQFRCMETVRAHSAVPAAPVRWLEDDESVLGRPFYVMDRVEGDVPPDNLPYTMDGWLLSAAPEAQRRLYEASIDVLAALHELPASLFDFLDRPGHGPVGLEQQLGEGAAYLEWVGKGRTQPVPEAALERLHETLPADPPPLGLNWGDSRIGNIMYRDFEPVAVLDWEMATLGPGEVDLGWYLFMHRFFTTGVGVGDLPGFPTEDDAVARYEAAVGRTVRDLEWHLLWAGFRYGVIMVRLVQIQRAHGIDPGWTEHDNLAIALLESML